MGITYKLIDLFPIGYLKEKFIVPISSICTVIWYGFWVPLDNLGLGKLGFCTRGKLGTRPVKSRLALTIKVEC